MSVHGAEPRKDMKPLTRFIAEILCATDCAEKRACTKCTHVADFREEAEAIIRLGEEALRNFPHRTVTMERLEEFARAVAPLYLRIGTLEHENRRYRNQHHPTEASDDRS